MADLKAAMQAFYDGFNARDADALKAIMADDFVDHEEFPGAPGDNNNPEFFLGLMTGAFPDFEFHVDDMLQEGDKVVARGRMTGTHEGEFMGMPATGKSFEISYYDTVEFRDGKAVAHWGIMDAAKMMEQLGAGG